jgi:hypothetical protein
MTAARDRADRKGSTPIQIGSTKLTSDGSDNLSVTNTSGTPKKLIASEVQLGTTANDTVILSRNASTGKLKLQTTSGGGSATDSSAGGITIYATISAMTAVSASAGDQALVTANSGLYVHNGGGWYKVATINTSPTISSPSTGANNTLATDGTATIIELVQADVDEGTTLQNSYSVTSGSLTNIASVTSSATSNGTYSSLAASTNTTNRFFKITPVTSPTTGGSVSLTFSASDGISAATTVQNFDLSFIPEGSTTFDGNGDALTVAASTDFAFGTGDFTIEAWVYSTTYAHFPYILDGRTNTGSSSNAPALYIHSSNNINYYVAGSNRISTSYSSYQNKWTHIAIVRNSGTTTLYLDGVSKGTWSDSTNYTDQGPFVIGRHGNSSNATYCLNGYISNFRIVKGTAVYTSNFTVPTSPLTAITNTILLTSQENTGTIIDRSSNNFTITVVGNAAANSLNPF